MANNPQSSGAQPLRPPMGAMAPQGFGAHYPMQFRPGMPVQQGQPFPPVANAQQFHPVGPGQNGGILHGQNQPSQFSQHMQQFPPRPGQPGNAAPSSQPIHSQFSQSSMPVTPGSQHTLQMGPPSNNHVSGLGGPGVPFSSSYTFAPPSFGQSQNSVNVSSQFQNSPQVLPPPPMGGQPWMQPGNQSSSTVTHMQQPTPQPSTSVSNPSDWQEFEATDGRRYYYNKVTKQSSWEKPLELMTPIERADASTVWKEFTTAEGRKYYYNKETKQSKWTIPEELKLAREQAEKAASQEVHLHIGVSAAATPPSVDRPSPAVPSVVSSVMIDATSSPFPVTPVATAITSPSVTVSGSPAVIITQPTSAIPSVAETVTLDAPKSSEVHMAENNTSLAVEISGGEASTVDDEGRKNGMIGVEKVDGTTSEEKPSDDEPFVYASKQEAKTAFKALLESANVEADSTWEQAMRLIINDKRYGGLKTLGERKQAFNEYLMQKKKMEAEEKRLRQRIAKEEFTKMLEESQELTSSTRWSKAVTMFEDDERFKAVEREADREDLFRSYLVDLQKKERAKAQEEHRRNRLEFRQYLETCGFIKVDSQWRKVQDLLEDDERCSRLDKIDRLEVYQEYIRDLEKEEEEQRKLEKEQLRRAERKNRDAFRKLMEEHVAAGDLTAKTHWRDYCQKVKDTPAYQGVALNTSGSTPMDLFEDVFEEVENQYHEDKSSVKDVLKQEEITVNATWSFEDFKAVRYNSNLADISDINLQLIYEDLLERAKEKEEKEAKKRQRLAKDFSDLLSSIKEITLTSGWEESQGLVEGSSEYRSIGDESICKGIFEEYIIRLQEKTKEKERKREEEKAKKEKEREEKEKKKEKEKREKEKEKEKEKENEREREKEKAIERSKKDEVDSSNMDVDDDEDYKEEKRREKDRERKHRKRHHNADDASSDKEEKEETRKSRRHGSDRRKSRKHGHSPESDGESRHKKHKRDRDGSRKTGSNEELEDGELGEDGEIQ